MPFRSKAQQGYLFANLPSVARRYADHTPKSDYKKLPKHVKKKADVSAEELMEQGPTHVGALKLLGPTDKPTQPIKTCGPSSSTEALKKQAQAYCGLTLAGLCKEACDRRDLPQVRAVVKLAEHYADTLDLGEAVRRTYPDASWVRQHDLTQALARKVAERSKDAGWLVDKAQWLEQVPGKAMGKIRDTVGSAWSNATGAFDRNVAQPVSNTFKPVGNFFSRLGNAWQGARQGWNQGAPAPAAPAPAAPKPMTAAAPGVRFSRKIAESMSYRVPPQASTPSTPKNVPTVAPASKRKTRYSFNRAPAKR